MTIEQFNLPCIVVDDGSDAATQQQLDNLVAEQPGVTLIRLAENAGKGAAVMRGLQAAADAGFSHAVSTRLKTSLNCWHSLNSSLRR